MSGSHFISLPRMKDCDTLYLFFELLFLSQNECFLFETHAMPYKWVLPPLSAFNHKNINNIRYNKLDKHRLFQISFGDIWLPWKQTNYIFVSYLKAHLPPPVHNQVMSGHTDQIRSPFLCHFLAEHGFHLLKATDSGAKSTPCNFTSDLADYTNTSIM